MYFLRTKALAEDIKHQRLTQTDWKNYYLVSSVVLTVVMALKFSDSETGLESQAISEMINLFGLVLITVLGINLTFKTNGGNQGQDYIPRATALLIPITAKSFLLMLLSIICLSLMGVNVDENNTWLWIIQGFALTLLIFWRLNVHLTAINTPLAKMTGSFESQPTSGLDSPTTPLSTKQTSSPWQQEL